MNIEEKLKRIIKEFDDSIDVESLSRDSRLKEDMNLNSISMLYIAVSLEDEFGIDFTDGNLGEIKTVGDLIDAIEARQ